MGLEEGEVIQHSMMIIEAQKMKKTTGVRKRLNR
jgi:hypothetical protein